MFARLFENWAVGRKRKELQSFLNGLRAADGEELGMVVACAADWRNTLKQAGVDLLHPAICINDDPLITYKLVKRVQFLQKAGKPEFAAGLMVWIHSLRAMEHLELRGLGREMWRELQRGFRWADSAADTFSQVKAFEFNIDNYDAFPDGLSPTPRA